MPRKKKSPPRPAATKARTAPHTPPPETRKAGPMPRLMTVDEVAELLRTTRKAVYAKIDRGQLPGMIRLSRRILFDAGVLRRWLDEQRVGSASELP